MANTFDPDVLTQFPVEYGYVSIGVPGQIATTYLTDNGRIQFHARHDIDEQKPKGKNVGRTKSRGVCATELSISFQVHPDEDEHFWTKVYPFLREKGKKGNVPPIEVYNSQVLYSGITTWVVADYNINDPSPRDGREVTIKFKEWSPKPVKPKADTAAKAASNPPGRPDPTVNIFD